jgi:cytochrome c oxidase assembly protein subunit 15
MVIIGGITRLTHSGLSITEWNLIMGTIPPLNDADWQDAFQKYQQTPEFQKINFDMPLEEFKYIFFWEFIHRFIGRMIGVVFLIPFIYFVARKRFDKEMMRKALFLFLLGGLQGVIGWYMVYSGLQNDPHVSHYRLAMHLITAFITFGFTLWFALDLIYPINKEYSVHTKDNTLYKLTKIILGIVCVQIIYGAFVAGLHAGKVYTTFPKMGEEWIASAVNAMQPMWRNFTENLAGVQFIHRTIAWLLVTLTGMYWFISTRFDLSKRQRNAITILVCVLVYQFLLGVFTLIYSVPVTLGVLHQMGAFFLFTSVIYLMHSMRTE